MQYLGSKKRIAKQLVEYMEANRKYDTYLEPFVGGLNVVRLMSGKRMASDNNFYVIETYKAVQNGWIPPTHITEEQWRYIKYHKDEDPKLSGFAGHACSFAGVWFQAFARDKRLPDLSFAGYGSRSLLRKFKTLKDVEFFH